MFVTRGEDLSARVEALEHEAAELLTVDLGLGVAFHIWRKEIAPFRLVVERIAQLFVGDLAVLVLQNPFDLAEVMNP